MTDKAKGPKKKSYTKVELAKIRKRLVSQKSDALHEIMCIKEDSLGKSQKEASGDLSGYSFHMADMATDLYEREFLLGLAEGEREMLYALDEALKRIDDGIYGVCDECGESVTKQRLKAMPQAKCCIKCQEIKEKKSRR
jgi:RNA polymerase-binding transcription factor